MTTGWKRHGLLHDSSSAEGPGRLMDWRCQSMKLPRETAQPKLGKSGQHANMGVLLQVCLVVVGLFPNAWCDVWSSWIFAAFSFSCFWTGFCPTLVSLAIHAPSVPVYHLIQPSRQRGVLARSHAKPPDDCCLTPTTTTKTERTCTSNHKLRTRNVLGQEWHPSMIGGCQAPTAAPTEKYRQRGRAVEVETVTAAEQVAETTRVTCSMCTAFTHFTLHSICMSAVSVSVSVSVLCLCLCLCLCLSLSSVSVARVTRSGFGPERKERNQTGQLILHSSQGRAFCPVAERIVEAVYLASARLGTFATPVVIVHRLSRCLSDRPLVPASLRRNACSSK